MTAPASRAERKVPPYSAHVSADVKTIWISAGPRAWDRARRWKDDGNPGLALPPSESPANFVWPVRGYNVALIATDMPEEDVAVIVRELMDAGAVVIATLFGPEDATRMELIANGRND